MSLTLFVIAINELSIRLEEALQQIHVQGVSLGPGSPPIHFREYIKI